MSKRYEVILGSELSTDLVASWSRIQRECADAASPFFSPGFTQAVTAVRDDVKVAVLTEDDKARGFLPFHRDGKGIGRAVAYAVSDVHGPLTERGVHWDMRDMLNDADLKAWRYFSAPAGNQALSPFHYRNDVLCPVMDLRDGFETYCAARKAAGVKLISQVQRKARKIERELGPLRLEAHTDDERAFEALLSWKADQYQRTGFHNPMRQPWVIELLRQLRTMQDDHFAGMLTALYVGDRVAAVHMGIRSERVLNWWFPAYDPALGKYSPGLILLIKLAEAVSGAAVERIDLGTGSEQYKSSFASDSIALARGGIDVRPVHNLIRKYRSRAKDHVRSLQLQGSALKWARRIQNRLATN